MLKHTLFKEDLHKCGIYTITNAYNEMTYVGSTKNFYKRFLEHKAALHRKGHANNYMQNAYTKHEGSGFTFTIMEVTDIATQLIIEQEYLDVYKDCWSKLYNIRRSVDIINYGPMPQATKDKIGAAQKGKPKSLEHLESLRLAGISKRGKPLAGTRDNNRQIHTQWVTEAITLLDGSRTAPEVGRLLGVTADRIRHLVYGTTLGWLVDEICEEYGSPKPTAKVAGVTFSDERKVAHMITKRNTTRTANIAWVTEAVRLLDGSRTLQEVADLTERSRDNIYRLMLGQYYAWLVDEICKEHDLPKPKRKVQHER